VETYNKGVLLQGAEEDDLEELEEKEAKNEE